MHWCGVKDKAFLYQFGACELSYGSKFPSVNSKGAMEAWKIFEKLGKAKAFVPSIRTVDDPKLVMRRGRDAWLTVLINVGVAQLYGTNQTKYVIAPMPLGSKGKGAIAASNGIGILKGSKNKKLAEDFVEYLTSPKTLTKIANGPGGFIPPVQEAINFLGDSAHDTVIKKGIEELGDKRTIISGLPASDYTSWSEVKGVIEDVFLDYALAGKDITQQVADDAQKKLDALRK